MTPAFAPPTGSPCDRVLAAIRQHRRESGRAPTLNEITRRTGVRRQHVGRALRRLEREGLVRYQPGADDPITLCDRAANLSDDEIEAAAHGRGARLTWSAAPALAEATPIDPRIPESLADLLDRLA